MPKDQTITERTTSDIVTAWIQALRLRTLPLAISGSLIAGGIGYHYGGFYWSIFLLMVLTSLLLQIISNFADEYGDLSSGLDDESRVGPIRGMQRGHITKSEMKIALIVTSLITIIVGVSLLIVSLGTEHLVAIIIMLLIGLGAIAAAMLYTMGSHPYGYIGLGDIMSFLFFGIVAVVGGSFLYLGRIEPTTFIPAIALGFPVVAVLNINNMRDAQDDKNKGKITVANVLGSTGMRVYHTVIIILSMVLFVLYVSIIGNHHIASFAFVLLYPLYIKHISDVWKVKSPKEFDPLMKPLSMGTFLLSAAFALCVAFLA